MLRTYKINYQNNFCLAWWLINKNAKCRNIKKSHIYFTVFFQRKSQASTEESTEPANKFIKVKKHFSFSAGWYSLVFCMFKSVRVIIYNLCLFSCVLKYKMKNIM